MEIVLPKSELPTRTKQPARSAQPENNNEPPHIRLSAKFNQESITKAMWVLFGCKADEATERREIHSPIEKQFQPSAHKFLVRYFARKALGDPESACEQELQDFFSDINEQRAKKIETGEGQPLDEKVLNRETIIPLVEEAIEKLVPKGP